MNQNLEERAKEKAGEVVWSFLTPSARLSRMLGTADLKDPLDLLEITGGIISALSCLEKEE
jgi:hypothetical protein